jgi:CHRD domain
MEFGQAGIGREGNSIRSRRGDRMTKTIAAMLAAGFALTAAAAGTAADHAVSTQAKKNEKMWVCHRGRAIRISERAVPAHVGHGDTVGRCGAGVVPAGMGFTRLRADLNPVANATGNGRAVMAVRAFQRFAVLCYRLNVRGVTATAAHIHTAAAQTIGNRSFAANAIVVPLRTPNANGVSQACRLVRPNVGRALIANPGSFYVNVHSAAFPNGQVQGTLTAS